MHLGGYRWRVLTPEEVPRGALTFWYVWRLIAKSGGLSVETLVAPYGLPTNTHTSRSHRRVANTNICSGNHFNRNGEESLSNGIKLVPAFSYQQFLQNCKDTQGDHTSHYQVMSECSSEDAQSLANEQASLPPEQIAILVWLVCDISLGETRTTGPS
jgi:hypothetical protein